MDTDAPRPARSRPPAAPPVTAESAGGGAGAPEARRISIGMFAAGFAVFAQIFGMQAMLPAVGRDFGIGASTAALTVSAATLGVAVSVLPWAWVADRIGRVEVMRISLVVATLVAFAAPLMPSIETVVAARALLGLALGAVPAVSVAFLVDELAVGRVAVAAGVLVAGNTLGGITGRLVGGSLSEIVGWRPASIVIAGAATVAICLFLLVLPTARGFRPETSGAPPLRTAILFQLRDPVMLGLYALGFLVMGAFGVVYNLLGFHLLAAPLSVPAPLVGLLFAAYLFGTFASRLSGTLATRWGVVPAVLSGIALMLFGLGLLLIPSVIGALGGLVVFTVGCFVAHPVASGQSGIRARLGRAQATALYQLSWLSGTALFGWAGGLVLEAAGWAATVGAAAALCVLAAALGVLGLHIFADRRPTLPPSAPPL